MTADEGAVVVGPSARRRGRLLVIDDQPMVLTALRRLLGREHDVVTAVGAREALERLADGAEFDVILCDVMMPEMDGAEFHMALLRVAPTQAERMLFLTGGAVTPRARAYLATVPNRAIEKPFDADALCERIRAALA
jgi:CheY-like chemotaxis protein